MRRCSAFLVSILLVAGFLVALPTATPVAYADVRAKSTRLSITPSTPGRGEPFTVAGRLSTQVIRPVQVQVQKSGKWRTIAETKTTASGRFDKRISLTATRMRIRIYAPKVRIGSVTYRSHTTASKWVVTGPVKPGAPIRGEQFVYSSKLAKSGVRPITLQARIGGRWKTIATSTTTKTGNYSFRSSTTATRLTVRVVAPKAKIGKKTVKAVTEKSRTIVTTGQTAALTLPSVGYAGQRPVVGLTFTPVREGRPVALQQYTGSAWKSVGTGVQDGTGSATVSLPKLLVGTYTYRAITLASNGAPAVASAPVKLTVNPSTNAPAPAIGTTLLGQGVVGEDYSAVLSASYGSTPLSWSASGLPAGLSVSAASGEISGVPTSPGTSSVTITVTDVDGRSDSKTLSLVIRDALRVDVSALSTGTAGVDFSASAPASGGLTPYAWTAWGLPAGMAIDEQTGDISGTPPNGGVFPVLVTVTDAEGRSVTESVDLEIGAGSVVANPPVIGELSIPDAVVGDSYSVTPTVTGGTPPYTWSGHGLPAGLSLDTVTGALTGTPIKAGDYTVRLMVTDSDGLASAKSFPVRVFAAAEVPPDPQITTATLPAGVVADSYSHTVTASGRSPFTWSATGVPTGLSLNTSTGVLSGTPTATGTSAVQITVTDKNNNTDSASLELVINPAVSVTTTSLPTAVVGEEYTATLAGVGGTTPYAWSASGLPTGMSVSGHQLIGTPTTAGTTSVTITVTDDHSKTATATLDLVVLPALGVGTPEVPEGTAGEPYTGSVPAAGGVEPYTWTAWGLPPGMAINSGTGEISGTPPNPGTFPVLVTVTDAQGRSTTSQVDVVFTAGAVIATAPQITTTALLDATKGAAYSLTVAATEGTTPYTWSGYGLPEGLSLDAATGEISGTPTKTGESAVYVMVADAVGLASTKSFTLGVFAAAEEPPSPQISTSSLPDGVVDDAYSVTLATTSGRAPFGWSQTGLPAGLSLDATTGVISGTPTATGTSTVQLTVTDKNGKTDTASLQLVVGPAVHTTVASLPSVVANEGYSVDLTAAGGTTPYAWSASGLPTGISVSGAKLTGTPTESGVFSVALTVTDSHTKTATVNATLVVTPAVSVTTSSLPSVVAGDEYSVTLAAVGGTAPYRWSASSLPAGITVSDGKLVGTPTTAGTSSVTLTVTDDHNKTASATLELTVLPGLGLGTPEIPEGTAGEPYTGSVPAAGGTGPYQYTAWGLPEGMTINPDTGEISGTPPNGGTFTVIVTVTDDDGHTTTVPVEITIGTGSVTATPPQITTTGLLDATQGAAYSVSLTATQGTTPYTWSAYGLPPGLNLDAATGQLSGTPTTIGDSTVYVMVTDSAGLASTTKSFALKVFAAAEEPPSPQISTSSLPDGVVDDAYSVTLATTSGRAPFVWSQTGLPAGLSLDATTGVISGTPTATGTSTVQLTVTDKNGKTDTASLQLVVRAAVHITTSSLPGVVANEGYSTTLTAAGGTTPYRWVASGLPSGLTIDPDTGALTGTPANAGTTSVTFTVTDAKTNTAAVTLELTVTPAVSVTTASLADAVVNESYSVNLAASGGTAPYSWAATGLPAGISVSGNELVGTATTAGTKSVTLTVTDDHSKTATVTLDLVVRPVVSISTTALPDGIVGHALNAQLEGVGGTLPYSWSATGLPLGLTLDADTGTLAGTPTDAGEFTAHVTVTDGKGRIDTVDFPMVIGEATTITTTALPAGMVGYDYSFTLAAAGGLAPYGWTSADVPAGLTLSSGGVLSGNPTTAGTVTVHITATDDTGQPHTKAFDWTIAAGVSVSTQTLDRGEVSTAYSATLAAAGGVAPYSWSQTDLPAGLELSTSGEITGTPTTAGTSQVEFTVSDANGKTSSRTVQLVIGAAVAVTTTSLPGAIVGTAYTATLAADGGTTPYTWAVQDAPAWLSVNASTGELSGTPDATGRWDITVTVTDANVRPNSRVVTLLVSPAVVISTTSLPDAVKGTAYSTTMAATGGRTPYAWSAANLPGGLSIDTATGEISGTPTTVETKTVTITVTDSDDATTSVDLQLVVGPAVAVATISLPDVVSGTSYATTLTATGGTTPYSWSVSGLPTGLSYVASTGVISGTTTQTGIWELYISASDANGKGSLAVMNLVVKPAVSVATTSLPNAVVGTAYSQTLAGANGTSPYTWTSTTLPAGLSLDTSTGVISGTPTASGTTSVTFTIHDANNKTATKVLSMVVNPAVSITTTSLSSPVVGATYSQTLAGANGTSPYTWSSTALPNGLSLNASTGVVSGTPTTAGTTSVTFTIHDANDKTATKTVSMVVIAVRVTTTSLPNAVVGTAYSQTLAGTDGTSPYTWTSTTLPAGLNLSSAGVLSGTPTTAGTTSVTFTIKDANNITATATLSMVVESAVSISTTSLAAAMASNPYSATLAGAGGTSPYTWSSTALPDGLSLNSATGVISGTPTTPGTTSVTFTIHDANSKTATKALNIVVDPALVISTTSLPSAVVDAAYSQTLTGVNGTTPYTWTSTALPAGLSLSSAGVLSGTPTTAGTTSVTFTLKDVNNRTATATLSLVVSPALSIATTSLADGAVGGDYYVTVEAVGGQAPYSWSATGLPTGLTIDTTSGLISGRPTQAGTSTVEITLTDAALLTATTTLSLVVPAPITASAMSIGSGSACALTSTGGVECSGDNTYGQLGNGTTVRSNTMVPVTGLSSGVTAVSMNPTGTSACALTDAGGVKCWGKTTLSYTTTPTDISGLTSGVTAVAAGSAHVCVVTSDGAVKCWGNNGNGQLGNGSNTTAYSPVAVSGVSSGATAVTAGVNFSCAIVSGAAKCWGYNSSGQLGNSSIVDSNVPVAVTGATSGVTAIAAGDNHTCAVVSGAAKCWGKNYYGQLGNSSTVDSTSPVGVSGLTSGVSAVSAGQYSTCALTTAGAVKCWGYNSAGQVGDGTTTSRNAPVQVSGLTTGATALAQGGLSACGLVSGSVKCWGSNSSGQFGNGGGNAQPLPLDVRELAGAVSAAEVGYSHVCALTTSGGVKCWGTNPDGELGNGTTTSSVTPVDVSGLTSGVGTVEAGAYQTCVLTDAGGVKCWGSNIYGQLGNGNTTSKSTPVDVSGLASGVVALAGGLYHTCALTSAGAVKCWGYNGQGQLGNGNTTNSSSPVAVSGLTSGVTAIAAGSNHTCALTSAGAVKCWGQNSSGQLGDASTTYRTSPVAVSGLTSGATAIAGGSVSTCAVVSGAAKCWGGNSSGELGDGTTTTRTSPVVVSGLTSGVASFAVSDKVACAVTTDGAVKCWGSNAYGQLATGTFVDSLTPTPTVRLTSGTLGISAFGRAACAVTSTHDLTCWGSNEYLQLGRDTSTNLTPVSVVLS